MDGRLFQEALLHLQSLDDRLTYKVRAGSRPGFSSLSADQLAERHRDLAEYTLELKQILSDLMQAIATKPTPQAEPAAPKSAESEG